MVPSFMVGSDAEGFLVDGSGKTHSAWGIIPGTKKNPHPTESGAIQADGALAEFNINPASSPEELVENIFNVRQELDEYVKKRGLKFVAVPSSEISWDQLDCYEVCVAGCDPDFDVWKWNGTLISAQNTPPSLEETNIRTAAAHIHLSWGGLNPDDQEERLRVVRNMDLLHTLPGLFIDDDRVRRTLYGKAGAFRFKPYGIEHRTGSNWWINKKEWIEWTFNQGKRAVEDHIHLSEKDTLGVVHSINNYDLDLAHGIIEKFKVEMP